MSAAALDAVLARADIWRGDALAVSAAPTLSSGFAALDAELPGGGWPRGQLVELLHAGPGLGELSLLAPALGRLGAAGETTFLIAAAAPGHPHAPAWVAAGLALDRLCLVRPRQPRDAVWAAVQSLRCPAVAATLLWLEDGAPLAANSLRRLQAAAVEGGGCAFLFRAARHAVQASPAPLRLRLAGDGGRLRVDILKRRGPPLGRPLELAVARPPALARQGRGSHAVAGSGAGGRRSRILAA